MIRSDPVNNLPDSWLGSLGRTWACHSTAQASGTETKRLGTTWACPIGHAQAADRACHRLIQPKQGLGVPDWACPSIYTGMPKCSKPWSVVMV